MLLPAHCRAPPHSLGMRCSVESCEDWECLPQRYGDDCVIGCYTMCHVLRCMCVYVCVCVCVCVCCARTLFLFPSVLVNCVDYQNAAHVVVICIDC